MAHIIDERLDTPNNETQENEEFETLAADDSTLNAVEQPQQQVQQTYQNEDEELPEKYRGKSAKEIAKMHQEAEKMIGRHSSEVGELRNYVDGFIKAQLANNATSAPRQSEQVAEVVDDDLDFYTDPKKAVSKAVENHPAVQTAKKMAEDAAKQRALSSIASKHPDMMDIVKNQEFINWVAASPVRKSLFVAANNNYDTFAADELLSNWKERSQVVQSAKDTAKQNQQSTLRAASTGSTKASGEGVSKKLYRRADIMNLLQNNPDRYNELYDEITAAYNEGRVR